MTSKKISLITFFVLVALSLNAFLWWGIGSHIRQKWSGVPPVPSEKGIVLMGLGDIQFSYRSAALTLQNLGDTGGKATPLTEYNYKDLDKWFWLLYKLDKKSNHIPLIAAYYFGATRIPEDSRIIAEYLAVAGDDVSGEKWRWLAQAAFLMRFRAKDIERSLDFAYKLSAMELTDDDMPMWARQMPAFILTAMGEKQAARAIVESVLKTDKNLLPNEINFMEAYLVERLANDAETLDFGPRLNNIDTEQPNLTP